MTQGSESITLEHELGMYVQHDPRRGDRSSVVARRRVEQLIAEQIIGDSLAIRRVREHIARVAALDLPVLIQGPTGSGKELVARALHAASGRSGRFVAFNACAIPEPLFEATLFGYAKGAYTGAVSHATGHLADADHGTAFADEISGLPLSLQPKLLRAVELREFRPLGTNADRRCDFRFLSATNENLASLVEAGRFRSDLAERLSTIIIDVPPLAERREDIPMLVRHFACRAAANALCRETTFDDDAIRTLQAYDWPRNVREFRNVVERACVFANGSIITVSDIIVAMGRPMSEQSRRTVVSRSDVERRELLAVLEATDWDTAQAAMRLGVHRATVYRRMERLRIPVARGR